MKNSLRFVLALFAVFAWRSLAHATCNITPSAPSTVTGTVNVTRTQSGGSCTPYHIFTVTNTNTGVQYANYTENDHYQSSPYVWNTATANNGGPIPNENLTIQITNWDSTYTTETPGTYSTITVNALNPVADNAKYLNFEKESLSQVYGTPRCPTTLDGHADGCYVQVQWAALEPCNANSADPTNSCYNWPMLDQELSVAESSNYPVDLEILMGGYGAPVKTNVCNTITWNSGHPTCSAWLGSGNTSGIAEKNGNNDGGISACSANWVPWPGDSTFRTALSNFEQALMTRYGGLMGNTLARVAISAISDSGDHLNLQYDGGLCSNNNTTETWYNSAWRTYATGTLGITGGLSTSEGAWLTAVEGAVENLYSDAFTNMAYSNFAIGIHSDDYPKLWNPDGTNASDGANDGTAHSDVWTSLSGNTSSDGSLWITSESLPDNTNFTTLLSAYTYPNTTWLASGEDHGVQGTEATCESWLVCPENTPTTPNGPIFSFRHWASNYTNSATNALVPYDTLMMKGTNETGQCTSGCP